MATKTVKATNGTKPMMVEANIDLDEKVRGQMIDMLNQQLADTTDLYSQTKHAHWNVKGPDFMQLHELFDMLAEGVEEYVDTIAERITALGGSAQGTIRMAADATSLPETSLASASGQEYLNHMVTIYSTKAKDSREAIDTAEEAGDMATSDLFNDFTRDLDKWRWFLEAHLQD